MKVNTFSVCKSHALNTLQRLFSCLQRIIRLLIYIHGLDRESYSLKVKFFKSLVIGSHSCHLHVPINRNLVI